MLSVMKQGPLNAYQIAAQMTWQMNGQKWEDTEKLQRWFATSETIAHLRFVEENGVVAHMKENAGESYELTQNQPVPLNQPRQNQGKRLGG